MYDSDDETYAMKKQARGGRGRGGGVLPTEGEEAAEEGTTTTRTSNVWWLFYLSIRIQVAL